MDDKLFLIAIGGTGMRCLEAFVHLCAAGLFDNKTIEILTLDTDQSNGNKGRVEELVELYNKVKADGPETIGGEQRTNTFFSAKLNLYRFFTDYSDARRNTLTALAQTQNIDRVQREDNKDISDLLFDPDTVQRFKLDHGYRAQTHLGSMLMYHGIIEAARNAKQGGRDVKPQERALKTFLELLIKHSSTARVFVFGSVFGGTGASSIPVIPTALSEAMRIITGGTMQIDLNRVLFGSTLLTDYFTFGSPTNKQRAQQHVIADANNFALNSQAALSFYNEDATVRSTYKRMYHIGWPGSLKINYSEGRQGQDVITGGHDQCNPCHVAEMLCACAAYDFFNAPREALAKIGKAEYVFRTVSVDANGVMELTGASFVGDEHAHLLENKLGAFLSFAHVVLSKFKGAQENWHGMHELLEFLNNAKFSDYNDLTEAQCDEIDQYLKAFGYSIVGGRLIPGWMFQVYRTVGNGTFIFDPQAFASEAGDVQGIDPGTIFLDSMHHWDKTGMILSSGPDRRFNTLVSLIRSGDTQPDDTQGVTLKERFLAHMYNAITIAQHYND